MVSMLRRKCATNVDHGPLNGIETTVRIKHTHPDVVVLGLSISVDEDHYRAMIAAGAAAVIAKMAVVDQLYHEIIKSKPILR